ncbi:MAG: choice-of-anchor D domain-containing protein [Bacteroidetes bacterium]|nr:choice-of-anchor D domain-containing protein [Bacteroidota bacterium]
MHLTRPYSRARRISIFAAVLLLSCYAVQIGAQPKWRISTPRDTVNVDAKGNVANGKIQLSAGTDFYLQISGTYSFWQSQPSSGVDADYTYKVPSWNIFSPLQNPPTYNSSLFDWGLWIDNTVTRGYYKSFSPSDAYQSSHVYTLRIPSQANRLAFRIKAPSQAYYNSASGGLTIRSARWTAGIAIESTVLDFGSVLVGQPSIKIDSIASYGIDPLQVDSVVVRAISPANNSVFTVVSEKGNKFTLPNESANAFRVTAQPDTTGQIVSELLVYSHNADANNRIVRVNLRVTGVAPKLGVGPDSINFGLVRIGTNPFGKAYVANTGSSVLKVTSATLLPAPPPTDTGVFSVDPKKVIPFDVFSGDIGQIKVYFNPKKREHYHGKLYVKGIGVPSDSVDLQGDGAEPIPQLSARTLDYGLVYKDDDSTQQLTLHNAGDWPCTVDSAYITGTAKAAYSFAPSDVSFFLRSDSTRGFDITLHAGAGVQGYLYDAYFVLLYDDNTKDSVHLTGIEKEPLLSYGSKEFDFGKVKVGASSTKQVTTVHNTSANTTASIWDQYVSPIDQYFSQAVLLPKTIAPNATLPLMATFAPLGPGAFQAYIVTNTAGKRDSIHLLGIGAVAKAIFNPSPMAYGIVKSDSADTLISILHDSGDYPLNVIRIEITGTDAKDFSVLYQTNGKTPVLPYTIQEDTTMPIEVRFVTHARTGLVHRATLCVYYDDSTSDCIPLEAIEEAQYLQFGQTSVDFGKVRVKTTALQNAIFKNYSGKPLSVDSVSVTGNAFRVLNQLGPVASRDSGAVGVTFTPATRGPYVGYLTGRGGDFRTDSIQVRGTGVAPIPAFLPDTVIDFGIVQLGAPNSKPLSLLNIGDFKLHATDIRIIGDPYGEFSYAKLSGFDPTQDTVDVNASPSQYLVTFTPSQPLVFHTARLLFTFDDSSQRIIVLKGYDESPYLVLDVDTLNFGKVRIGSAPSDSIRLVSTSHDTLTAYNVSLNGAVEFTAAPLASTMPVPPRTLFGIAVTFKPLTIGSFAARLTMINDSSRHPDTTFIYGVGAKAIPTFLADSATHIDTLDFGAMFNGYSATRTIMLADSGNWEINTLSSTPTGANAGDFTPNFPQQFTIAPGGGRTISITYKASTAFQAGARTAKIDFIMDDSSTFTLYLKAQDIPPIPVQLKFDNMSMRPADVVYPNLRLRSTVPDSLKLNHLSGVVTWDPAVAAMLGASVSPQLQTQSSTWTLVQAPNDPPGQLTYDLYDSLGSGHLSAPSSLIRMKFKATANAKTGAQTTLTHSVVSFPYRNEVTPLETQGVLIVDDVCGNTHLVANGSSTANFIEMNMPNPFGASAENDVTTIPFNVGSDGTSVTIRILDVTGAEVSRPIDHQSFAHGFYNLQLSGQELPNSGVYFYEFKAGADAPVVRKMLVTK